VSTANRLRSGSDVIRGIAILGLSLLVVECDGGAAHVPPAVPERSFDAATRLFKAGAYAEAMERYRDAFNDLIVEHELTDRSQAVAIQVQVVKCNAKVNGPDSALTAVHVLVDSFGHDLSKTDVADLGAWLKKEGYAEAAAHLDAQMAKLKK
jgi:hypothetical protein